MHICAAGLGVKRIVGALTLLYGTVVNIFTHNMLFINCYYGIVREPVDHIVSVFGPSVH